MQENDCIGPVHESEKKDNSADKPGNLIIENKGHGVDDGGIRKKIPNIPDNVRGGGITDDLPPLKHYSKVSCGKIDHGTFLWGQGILRACFGFNLHSVADYDNVSGCDDLDKRIYKLTKETSWNSSEWKSVLHNFERLFKVLGKAIVTANGLMVLPAKDRELLWPVVRRLQVACQTYRDYDTTNPINKEGLSKVNLPEVMFGKLHGGVVYKKGSGGNRVVRRYETTVENYLFCNGNNQEEERSLRRKLGIEPDERLDSNTKLMIEEFVPRTACLDKSMTEKEWERNNKKGGENELRIDNDYSPSSQRQINARYELLEKINTRKSRRNQKILCATWIQDSINKLPERNDFYKKVVSLERYVQARKGFQPTDVLRGINKAVYKTELKRYKKSYDEFSYRFVSNDDAKRVLRVIKQTLNLNDGNETVDEDLPDRISRSTGISNSSEWNSVLHNWRRLMKYIRTKIQPTLVNNDGILNPAVLNDVETGIIAKRLVCACSNYIYMAETNTKDRTEKLRRCREIMFFLRQVFCKGSNTSLNLNSVIDDVAVDLKECEEPQSDYEFVYHDYVKEVNDRPKDKIIDIGNAEANDMIDWYNKNSDPK